MKKVKSVLLAGMLIISMIVSLTGCAGKDKATESAATTPAATQTQDTQAVSTESESGYVETPMDLHGRVIQFVTPWAWQWKLADVEENTSNEIRYIVDVLHSVETDYNCKIEIVDSSFDTYLEDFATKKAAGDKIGDIFDYTPVTHPMTDLIKSDYFMPVDDIKTLNVKGFPWHMSTAFSVYNGKTYGVGYQFKQSGDVLRDMVLFNKNLAEKYKLGNFYQMVRDKTFTFDKFREICEKVKERSGGRVTPVVSARNEQWLAIPLVIANGGNFFESSNGILSYTGNSDKVKEALHYFGGLTADGLADTTVDGTPVFKDGEALFLFDQYWAVRDHFSSDMEDDYGIIPPPIGPGATDFTSTLNDGRVLSIFNNVENPEEIGAVITAIANRANNSDWQDRELQYALRDEASVQMIEIMYDRQVVDYSNIVPNSDQILTMLNNVATGAETPQEGLDRIDSIMKSSIDEYYAEE